MRWRAKLLNLTDPKKPYSGIRLGVDVRIAAFEYEKAIEDFKSFYKNKPATVGEYFKTLNDNI